jgi:hypothetical protein
MVETESLLLQSRKEETLTRIFFSVFLYYFIGLEHEKNIEGPFLRRKKTLKLNWKGGKRIDFLIIKTSTILFLLIKLLFYLGTKSLYVILTSIYKWKNVAMDWPIVEYFI